jgi:hypothetical protein
MLFNKWVSDALAVMLIAGGVIGAPSAQAACPTWPTATRFVINGAEVRDLRTNLVWARCSVGQTWDGATCSGTPTTHTREQALQLAQAATGWRLPNRKELSSLADRGCREPAIDSTAFPQTASTVYWSSTPFVGYSFGAWQIDFLVGWVGYFDYGARGRFANVRLVRATP